uniref:Uncharacterized protein n=1 Tax=Haptolina brevifila TaxID=156173 RepID=A0A6U7DV01_9EUKA|mmetsp:Transcript_28883/g.58115  ORF Transcript_28883/g.58115 Transcript_28883/m.58115 type:complete len:108 (+) Transcript_28883:350-673(+)
MYVFDLGTGACLTDAKTADARTYAVIATAVAPETAATVGDELEELGSSSSNVVHIWLRREPVPKPRGPYGREVVGTPACNSIQLKLVEAGLRRRFGPGDDDDNDATK